MNKVREETIRKKARMSQTERAHILECAKCSRKLKRSGKSTKLHCYVAMTKGDWEKMVLGNQKTIKGIYLSKQESPEGFLKNLLGVVGKLFKGARAFTVMETTDYAYKKLLAIGLKNTNDSVQRQVALLRSCGRYVGQTQSFQHLFCLICDKVTIVER